MRKHFHFSRIYVASFLLSLIFLIGILGFIVFEDYTLTEAFYMTVITVSTVGFSEVRELTDNGRVFTSFLIITSFGTFAYAISIITTYIVSGDFRDYYKNYQVTKEVKKIRNHVIVCGYGRNGQQAIKSLLAHKQEFIIIENGLDALNEIKSHKNWLFVEGDATDDRVLKKANIENAKALITSLPHDADNLFIVVSARQASSDIMIISRASLDSSYNKLKIAGANNVIMPDKVGGEHMASLVVSPDVVEFLDHISVEGEHTINLEAISYNELPEEKRNCTIRELSNSADTGCTIIGFKTPDGKYVINPSADTELIPNSKLFVLGKPEQIEKLNKLFNIE